MAIQQITRQQQILEALAVELESHPCHGVTIGKLAKTLGISETAIYRQFSCKAKMFEALIEFSEQTIFSLITRIEKEESLALQRCQRVLSLVLGFADRNPGITRLLTGNTVIGEKTQLHQRVYRIYERLETQIKQFLREGVLRGELSEALPVGPFANLMLSYVEGRLYQFVHSGFKRPPLECWETQWQLLRQPFDDYRLETESELYSRH